MRVHCVWLIVADWAAAERQIEGLRVAVARFRPEDRVEESAGRGVVAEPVEGPKVLCTDIAPPRDPSWTPNSVGRSMARGTSFAERSSFQLQLTVQVPPPFASSTWSFPQERTGQISEILSLQKLILLNQENKTRTSWITHNTFNNYLCTLY